MLGRRIKEGGQWYSTVTRKVSNSFVTSLKGCWTNVRLTKTFICGRPVRMDSRGWEDVNTLGASWVPGHRGVDSPDHWCCRGCYDTWYRNEEVAEDDHTDECHHCFRLDTGSAVAIKEDDVTEGRYSPEPVSPSHSPPDTPPPMDSPPTDDEDDTANAPERRNMFPPGQTLLSGYELARLHGWPGVNPAPWATGTGRGIVGSELAAFPTPPSMVPTVDTPAPSVNTPDDGHVASVQSHRYAGHGA